MFQRFYAVLIGVFAMMAPLAAQETIEDGFLLPVTVGGQTYRLEAYSVRLAATTEPMPLVIISHGTAFDFYENELTHASNYRTTARDFAWRGWHAVAIVRRGFGVSEGPFPRAGACGVTLGVDKIFDSYADDVLAAVEALGKHRDPSTGRVMSDTNRVLFIGASTGGLTSLLAASRFKGSRVWAVNMSGGWKSARCEWIPHVADIFSTAGKASAARGGVPTRWFYAENDSFFAPTAAERFLAAYRNAGGNARITMYPPIGEDGHHIFSEARGKERWWPELDQFLAENGLPHLTPAMITAAMDRAKVPQNLRASAERYIRLSGEKAMAVTADGKRSFWRFSHGNREEARKRALEDCNKAQAGCKLLMVNNLPAP